MTYTSTILANIILVLHVLYILFVILVPFSNSNYLLFLHVIIVPFMILHWILNDNSCFLTLVEKYLRTGNGFSKDNKDCFTCKLIEPVYDFEKNHKNFSDLIYIVTVFLWVFSFTKLYNKYTSGQINNLRDLSMI